MEYIIRARDFLLHKDNTTPNERLWPKEEFLERAFHAVARMKSEPKMRKVKNKDQLKPVKQRKFEDRRLADLMKITTNTLYRYYRLYPGTEKKIQDRFDALAS